MAAVIEESIQPDEGTLARWRRDAARWARLKMQEAKALMHTGRGPEDYELTPDDMAERVVRIIERRFRQPSVFNNGDGGNGEKTILKWILGVVGALLIGAVGGGIASYGKLSAIEATLNTVKANHEQRIDRLERERDARNAPP